MNNDFKELVRNASNKVRILSDNNELSNNKITNKELKELINEFLNDLEKYELLKYYKKNKNILRFLINNIKTEKLLLLIMQDEEIIFEIESYELLKIINELSESARIDILKNDLCFNKLGGFKINTIIKSLSDEEKMKILNNPKYLNQNFDLNKYEKIQNIISLTDLNKMNILKNNKYNLNRIDTIAVIKTLDIKLIIELINDRKIFGKFEIESFNIVSILSDEKQEKIIQEIDTLDVSIEEKKKIIAKVNEEVKARMDIQEIKEEYRDVFSINVGRYIKKDEKYNVTIDFSEDLEKYKDLDEIIMVNPINMNSTEKENLKRLCKINPKLSICDNLPITMSSGEEYIKAEEWIDSIIGNIDESWSDIQKLAYIDSEIGKKISYAPNFETGNCKTGDVRALWKIIDTGYGVCNGISQVEQYILKTIGIESICVSGKKHSFLRVKDIEINTDQGTIIADTLVDPTWNLAANRFEGKPSTFCKSYDEMRKEDIRENGEDTFCHENKELEDVIHGLSEIELRKIYTSIGIADENGDFNIKKLLVDCEKLNEMQINPIEIIERKLRILECYYPEFASCQNSTISILNSIIDKPKDLKQVVINRVYLKEDDKKEPNMYIYLNSENEEEFFYVGNKRTKRFDKFTLEEFEKEFECYDTDIYKYGKKPWEELKKQSVDMTQSSGKVESSEKKEEEER